MFHRFIVPLSLTTLIAVAPVTADQATGKTGESRAEPYQNLLADEAGGGVRSFDRLDRNQDGRLDEDELNAWGGNAAGEAGANREEADARTERILQKFDQDDDDAISKEELSGGPDEAGDARGSNL